MWDKLWCREIYVYPRNKRIMCSCLEKIHIFKHFRLINLANTKFPWQLCWLYWSAGKIFHKYIQTLPTDTTCPTVRVPWGKRRCWCWTWPRSGRRRWRCCRGGHRTWWWAWWTCRTRTGRCRPHMLVVMASKIFNSHWQLLVVSWLIHWFQLSM